MNQLQQRNTLLSLLKQGLWGEDLRIPDEQTLTLDDWKNIYTLAQKQTVQGIVYDGINRLSKSSRPPMQFLIPATVGIDQLERISRLHNQTLLMLHEIFSAAPAIPFILIKGQSVAALYPDPSHRVCGDIDLWFGSAEQAEAANRRIEQYGIPVDRGANSDSSYFFNQVFIEHHTRLIDLHNPVIRKKIDNWESRTFRTETTRSHHALNLNNCSIPILPPVATHLLMSTHVLKHMLNEGIGLRQLCDLAIFTKSMYASLDKQEYIQISKSWGIYRWNKLLYALLVKYLGLSTEYLPFETTVNPDILLNEIWETGNFGHQDTRYNERPEGKWSNKWHTVKMITAKMKLFGGYAPSPAFWWISELTTVRLKELLLPDESTDSENNR